MRLKVILQFAVVFATMLLAAPQWVQGQVLRVSPPVARPLIGTGSLTVSASPSAVSFLLVPGQVTAGNSPIGITTTWTGSTVGSTMSLYGYFLSSTSALTGNGRGAIPTTAIFGQMTTGLPTSSTPFTETNPVGSASGSLRLFSQVISGTGAGSRTDALTLTIDLTSLPQLPADTYTGTLILQAQVI